MIDFLYTLGIAATAIGIILAAFGSVILLVMGLERLEKREDRRRS
jgi:hypothetical protein